MNQSPLTLSVAEVCKTTGIGRTSIFNAIRDGKLRAVKLGNRTLIRAEDLKAFLDNLPAISSRSLEDVPV